MNGPESQCICREDSADIRYHVDMNRFREISLEGRLCPVHPTLLAGDDGVIQFEGRRYVPAGLLMGMVLNGVDVPLEWNVGEIVKDERVPDRDFFLRLSTFPVYVARNQYVCISSPRYPGLIFPAASKVNCMSMLGDSRWTTVGDKEVTISALSPLGPTNRGMGTRAGSLARLCDPWELLPCHCYTVSRHHQGTDYNVEEKWGLFRRFMELMDEEVEVMKGDKYKYPNFVGLTDGGVTCLNHNVRLNDKDKANGVGTLPMSPIGGKYDSHQYGTIEFLVEYTLSWVDLDEYFVSFLGLL